MSMQPALLGGTPVFPEGIALTRPTTPPWEEVAPVMEKMYRSGWLTKGPYLQAFEEKVREALQVPHVVAVSCCTSALILGLQALFQGDSNLKSRYESGCREVIVPSFSFMATFHALRWNGLEPVFVDCDPQTFTVDPEKVRQAIGPRTVGIMAACVFGNPPDWEALERIAEEHSLPLFSDSAHGLGTLDGGHPLGRNGRFEAFSLSPTKLLPAGEGGILATRDAELAAWVKRGCDYGNPGDYSCAVAGINGRMSEFHAIVGLTGLPYLENYAVRRNQAVDLYRGILGDVAGLTFQKIKEGARSSYKDFGVVVDPEQFGLSRDQLAKALKAEGIPSRAYFNPPGHLLETYAGCRAYDLSCTERLSQNIICLPIDSQMDLSLVERICGAIRNIQAHAAAIKSSC